MWEWVQENSEWVFSGVGISLACLLIWAARSLFQRLGGAKPYVTLNLAIGALPFGGTVKALTISLVNPTKQDVVIGNFLLEFTSRETMYFQYDSFTGVPQGRNVVRPGDSCSFHIDIAVLRETGLKPDDFQCALVQTPTGPGFRTSRKELHRFLQNILRQSPGVN
jgi:hypothetical protein